jgi:hypothetical protein
MKVDSSSARSKRALVCRQVKFIAVSGDLVELNELFNLFWWRIIPLGRIRRLSGLREDEGSTLHFPFLS